MGVVGKSLVRNRMPEGGRAGKDNMVKNYLHLTPLVPLSKLSIGQIFDILFGEGEEFLKGLRPF